MRTLLLFLLGFLILSTLFCSGVTARNGDGSAFFFLADTGVVVTPSQVTFNGNTGAVFNESMKIKNFTSAPVQITITDSAVVTKNDASSPSSQSTHLDIPSIVKRLRSAFRNSHITSLPTSPSQTSSPLSPEAFTTIITDDRGEAVLGSVDIYRVQYQFQNRIFPVAGNYHDFRIILGNLPDTNIIGFISIDTDQDFGTGTFPAPFGLGPTSRDIGSEREIFFDASGLIMDSLGLGRIRAGVVLSTVTDTIVGTPFLLSITRDSVTSIATNLLGLGIRDEWLGDPDRKMNVGVVAIRFGSRVNPLPDFAPQIGHGIIGTATGASWLSQSPAGLAIAAGDSAIVNVRGVAAKTAGIYSARVLVQPVGRPSISLPVNMTVTTPPSPRIIVTPLAIRDTLNPGLIVTKSLQISNVGGGQLVFGLVDTAGTPWFTAAPTYGTLDSGQTTFGSVTLRTEGLTLYSNYSGRFFVTSNDPLSNAIPVDVLVRIEIVNDVDQGTNIPSELVLHQNYPNPFNPTTEIRYQIPEARHVSLNVYDVLGREIAILVNDKQPAGTHSVSWNAADVASGVYYYRLSAGGQAKIMSMMIIR